MVNRILHLWLILYLQNVWLLDPCEEHDRCRDCILDKNSCVWCASNEFKDTKRCKSESSEPTWCPLSGQELQNPKSFVRPKPEDRDFSSKTSSVTQIKPQRYMMSLRPGDPLDFSFSFKGSQNYPVDVYFLFDASASMVLVKNHTVDNSENIFKTVKNMTNDVFFGMGSFIDKNTLPFTVKVTDHVSYSYRHHLSLTNDYIKFQETVKSTPVGRNRDKPEGGLDALAQAIVCGEHIGWREQSRKIIVFLTNGPYHAAGNGKSGGIFKPYDGECNMENGAYTKELEMDYPSVSTINKLVKENDVIVIFGVSSSIKHVYKPLADAVSGAKMVEIDVKGERGIATILKEIYENITRKIKLKINQIPGRKMRFEISLNPDCREENPECNVVIGKEHLFNGTIKLLEYSGLNDTVVDVSVEGLNEKLRLQIDVINDCECTSKAESDSTYCNSERQECGACVCSEKKYGYRCACDRAASTEMNNNATCYGEGMTEACNGTGTCVCGACVCDEGFKGRYCDCSATNCTRNAQGYLCSGQGECLCNGTCDCNAGWSGDYCQCPDKKSQDDCRSYNGKVCNDRGECKCGACKCQELAGWDKHNEQDLKCVMNARPGSLDLQCKILNDCVLYRLENDTINLCNFTDFDFVDKLPEETNQEGTYMKICPKVRVDVGCYKSFAYTFDEVKYRIILTVEKGMDCAKIYYMTGGIVLSTLLLGGILTLVAWKLCTEYRDRKEYENFVKDHKEDISGPCQNPIYEPAITHFSNPAFRKRSVYN